MALAGRLMVVQPVDYCRMQPAAIVADRVAPGRAFVENLRGSEPDHVLAIRAPIFSRIRAFDDSDLGSSAQSHPLAHLQCTPDDSLLDCSMPPVTRSQSRAYSVKTEETEIVVKLEEIKLEPTDVVVTTSPPVHSIIPNLTTLY